MPPITSSQRERIKSDFSAYYCTEENCKKTISDVFGKYSYLIDPHTAVAVYAAHRFVEENRTGRKNIVASTASPYKFAIDVLKALGQTAPENDFDVLKALSEYSKTDIPAPLAALSGKTVRFTQSIEKNPEDLAKAML